METGENLYRRFLEGDKKAFDELVVKYRAELIFFVNSYVHDTYEAEDIAIDCFVYMLTHPGSYNFKSSVKTYLFIIGRSRAIDCLRRRSRLKAVSPEDAKGELTDDGELLSSVIDTERKKQLHNAVEKLPEDVQKAVRLFYFDELSYCDIAKILKKKPKQIDNMLYKAREKLRKELMEEGDVL